MVTADPLTVALGRPNREQVTTSRAAAATTLQALELANGATLANVLEQGAKKLLADARTAEQRDRPRVSARARPCADGSGE